MYQIFSKKGMSPQTKIISDQKILSMLSENDLKAWEYLYDKYAPAMYGIVCSLTDDLTVAQEIFKDAFIQLRKRQIFANIRYALCPFLLRHTYGFAKQQLNDRGIMFPKEPMKETSLINIFCSEQVSIKGVASRFDITEEEAKRKLQLEFLAILFKKKE